MDITKLLSLLRVCIDTKSVKNGKIIHQKIITSGLQENIASCKSLINLYFSCQAFEYAKLVFQRIENPLDITLWNGLMASYTKNFLYNEALGLFRRLFQHPYLKPDSYTYPSVLKACGGLVKIDSGKMIHALAVKNGFLSDVVVASSMFGLYAKCDQYMSATQLFDEMPERDVASWNAVISCYFQSGQYEKALKLFEDMKISGFIPDSVTFTTVISSCARLLNLERGMEIHQELVRSGFLLDGFISAALIDLYGKCGYLDMAIEVFEQIPRKSLVAWNSMITGYSLVGKTISCIALLLRMNEEGIKPTSTTFSSLLMACSKSAALQHGKFIHGYMLRSGIELDIFIYSSLLDLYFKCGNVASAEFVFQNMPKTNVVAWNVMISGYVSVGCYFEALHTFNEMKIAGVKPDAITFTSTLPACSQLAALEQGKEIHRCVTSYKHESNEIVMGALLDMYAKCGAVDEARTIFNQLLTKDLVSWTSMITAYGSHGQASEALSLFKEMQQSNAKLDRITFLSVISACSHAGLVDEGCYYFSQMINDYGLQPTMDEYSCLIDLLGRAGKLNEAYKILQRTPSMRENSEVLSTLFSACRRHGELELGVEIAKLLMERDPDDPSTYAVLANMYASIKKWDEARKVRSKMMELGLRKKPGCSWIST